MYPTLLYSLCPNLMESARIPSTRNLCTARGYAGKCLFLNQEPYKPGGGPWCTI